MAKKFNIDIVEFRSTKFELIDLWHNVGGDPVPTAIADCDITYSIIKAMIKYTCDLKILKLYLKLIKEKNVDFRKMDKNKRENQ